MNCIQLKAHRVFASPPRLVLPASSFTAIDWLCLFLMVYLSHDAGKSDRKKSHSGQLTRRKFIFFIAAVLAAITNPRHPTWSDKSFQLKFTGVERYRMFVRNVYSNLRRSWMTRRLEFVWIGFDSLRLSVIVENTKLSVESVIFSQCRTI